MKYSAIIDGMTWSYSRLTCFESCPYSFLLKYIMHTKQEDLFFSEFGKLIHQIIGMTMEGFLDKGDAVEYYCRKFPECTRCGVPNSNISTSYFQSGLAYVKAMELPPNPIVIERRGSFEIDNKSFVGIIDCAYLENGKMILQDHKSHDLKPRSGREKPTKSDIELDRYLRQLYIYSALFKDWTGEYPDVLRFNCYRTQTEISEEFDPEVLKSVLNWASLLAERIIDNDDWSPNIDYWKCRYLCDVNQECEYHQANRR